MTNDIPAVFPDPINADGENVLKLIREGESFIPDEDGVYMPYWYFEKLFDYVVDVETFRQRGKNE